MALVVGKSGKSVSLFRFTCLAPVVVFRIGFPFINTTDKKRLRNEVASSNQLPTKRRFYQPVPYLLVTLPEWFARKRGVDSFAATPVP